METITYADGNTPVFLVAGVWLLVRCCVCKAILFITRINKADVFDKFYNGIAKANQALNRLLSVSQNGSLRWYIAGVLIGILFILALQLLLWMVNSEWWIVNGD